MRFLRKNRRCLRKRNYRIRKAEGERRHITKSVKLVVMSFTSHTNFYEPFKLFRISSTDLKSLNLRWSRLYYPDK